MSLSEIPRKLKSNLEWHILDKIGVQLQTGIQLGLRSLISMWSVIGMGFIWRNIIYL